MLENRTAKFLGVFPKTPLTHKNNQEPPLILFIRHDWQSRHKGGYVHMETGNILYFNDLERKIVKTCRSKCETATLDKTGGMC